MNKEEFKGYLMSLKIPENISLDKEREKVSDLHQKNWSITPKNLYRYRECSDYHIDAFKKDELWLSKPCVFNDPHDSLIYVNKAGIISSYLTSSSELEQKKHDRRLIEDREYREENIKILGKEFVENYIEELQTDRLLAQNQKEKQIGFLKNFLEQIIIEAKKV